MGQPEPYRVISLKFRAERAQYSLAVNQSDSASCRTVGSILFNGTIFDEQDWSCFNGARFSLTVLKSLENELNAELDIYPELNAPTDSPELLLAGGYPPIMGYLMLPSDAFEDLRLQANFDNKKWFHTFTLDLPIAEELYDREHPNFPTTREAPVPLTALNLEKKIKMLGCDHFSYTYAKDTFRQ